MFTDKLAVGAGAVVNATAVGRAIDLDPREPPDNLDRPYRVLHYPPLAVWVEPVESPVPLGNACGEAAPPNCMPVTLVKSASAEVTLPKGVTFEINGSSTNKWTGKRVGFPLGDGFCVTDYYAQGQSFRSACWLAHLAKPDKGALQRASVLVTLTRFRDWDAVLPWAPLWPEGDADRRDKVIEAFHRVARPSDDLHAELERLRIAEERTLREMPQEIRDLLQT